MTLHYKIVTVLDGNTLLDRDCCVHTYMTREGTPLQPGVYLVMWPADVTALRFDGDARYVGPFTVSHHVEPLLYRCVEEYLAEKRAAVAIRRASH